MSDHLESPGPAVLDPTRPLAADAPRRTPAPAEHCLALPAGFRLLEYRIDGVLGQGGFGIAYAATDVNLNARVVVKEYLPEEFAFRAADNAVRARADEQRNYYQVGLDSFLVEARTLATFRHRNIVRVARFFEANRTAYMVLEYERGQSLKAWRAKRGHIPEETLVALLAPLLDGLTVVHRSGYLHRDIKPDNIYVRDEDGSLVLLDFGAARQTATERAESGAIVTPGYGPIEEYASGSGRQGPWTDIYSLGATLYWLITGKKPPASTARLAEPDPLEPAADLCRGRYSPEFLSAIDWALRMHPDDRPADVARWRSALFAAHPAALGLQEALRASDRDGTLAPGEGWGAALRSARVFRARGGRVLRLLARPGSWPLSVKMTLAMVATALLPMTITAYHNLGAAVDHVAAVELRNLEQIAQSTAGRIGQLIGDSRNLADYVGTDDDFVAYLARPTKPATTAILAKLEGIVQSDPDVQFAMVMDTAGNAIVASDPEVMGKNFRFREYFRQAMQGRAHMTGMTVGAVAGKSGVFYSRPVFAAGGREVIGAVVLRIRAEPIGRILDSARVGEERVPFLVDGDGIVIWHPDERRMFRSLVPLRKEVLDKIVADQRFRRASIESSNEPRLAASVVGAKERGNVRYYSSATRREEVAGYAPVPGNDWVVAVSESRDYFAAPLDRMMRNVLYSVVLVGAVFVLAAMLFARSIVQPIARLTAAAHALKAGDYANANVAVRSDDEIGRLARTFNVMIDVLRQRERERGGHPAQGAAKDGP